MITWGISANSHDAGLAVFDNKKLVFASQSERFSRIKNDPDLDKNLISYAKQWGDPDQVVWYENPIKKTLRQLRAGQGLRLEENNIKSYLSSYIINRKIKYVDHHASHAYGGWHTSKLDDSCIICIDAIGEFETFTIWDSTKKKLKKIYSQSYPHSIGLWYSAMTQRIGLKPNEDEYILMGMAAYGDPTRLFEDIINSFIHTHGMGVTPKVTIEKNLHRGCKDWRPDLKSEQDMFDIAAGTQAVYEYLLRYISTWAKQNSKHNNLIFMGGCALNCVANNILTRDWNNIWIMPNPGDSGSAIGCVLAHFNKRIKWDDTFLGYDIKGDYQLTKFYKNLKTQEFAELRTAKQSLVHVLLVIAVCLLILGGCTSKTQLIKLNKDKSSDLLHQQSLTNFSNVTSKVQSQSICSLQQDAEIQMFIQQSHMPTIPVGYKVYARILTAAFENC